MSLSRSNPNSVQQFKIIMISLITLSTCQEKHTSLKAGGLSNDSLEEMSKSNTAKYNGNKCNESDEIEMCGTIEYMGCTGSKKLYHESAIKMNWFEAWEYCRSIGLHLAAIESRYEQTFIELFLPSLGVLSTETYWTSGTDLGKEGQFYWMGNGRSLTYWNFRQGEPNNRFGSENCVELVIKPDIVGYLWNDRNCFAKGYVICQHDVRYPDTPIQIDTNKELPNI